MGAKARAAQAQVDHMRLAAMRTQDRLDDTMQGFEFWRQHKVESMEWTTWDEMLARWLEHKPHVRNVATLLLEHDELAAAAEKVLGALGEPLITDDDDPLVPAVAQLRAILYRDSV